MPITFTAIGDLLDVVVIDDNIKLVQDLFKEQIRTADLRGDFARYRISKFTSGKIVSSKTFANPWRSKKSGKTQINEILDINYVAGTEDAGRVAVVKARESQGARNAFTMELLGLPGPSFHLSWQEDGLAAPVGAGGWPPTDYPYTRFPSSRCYSRWMTIPGASMKVYVPERCIAKIRGHAKGSLTAWQAIRLNSTAPHNITVNRDKCMSRFGLIVDTNPIRYSDEFANTNPNVKEGVGGAMATHCTWKVVEDITMNHSQREVFCLEGEVALKGRRWYNFRFAFRDPGHHGWVREDTGAWVDSLWENSWFTHPGVGNAPNVASYITSLPSPISIYAPPWLTLWESGSLDLEFRYGRGNSHIKSTADAEFGQIFKA
jgi:hypothetical protein